MGLTIRESDEIRNVKSLDGKEYRLQKSAYGFGEQITFYDKEGNVIEEFSPTSDYEYTVGIHECEDDEKVEVEGSKVRAEFSFSEWYE